ncbi:unnamed protein product [Adineta steineri]|uniref:Uncharacterized protein n=1 Tax=Adineta steineri TaxID=433720 RepID=A0A819B1G2_9BILA|nr:unnamed protein product [Adineta steineri]CAF3789159.1 unnamed protein product [Adineta steineri]
MYTKTQSQENNNDNNNQQQENLSTTNSSEFSISNASAPISNDERASHIAQLLQEANLPDLIQLDTINQIQYFLYERDQLMTEAEHIRIHYEKQYQILRHHHDQTENNNEHLIVQIRTLSKELILYKHLVEAPENLESSTKPKDYQQLKQTIEEIVRENERLHSELNYFKTSDPVYEQVQLLETTNIHLKQELNQVINDNNHLKQIINLDEIQYLKTKLTQTIEECEQLKADKEKFIQQQTSSSLNKEEHIYSSPPNHQESQVASISVQSLKPIEENPPTNDIVELHQHVHRLEQTIQQRDYELQKLQSEIEKGTCSIMSSIEDLYMASSNISSPTSICKSQPSINELQNEIDQLHDRLNELTQENQTLKLRIQEIDTIYEENEYLYAEKTQWTEEMEQTRLHQLALQQEINILKQREKEFLFTNDPSISVNDSNTTKLKLKIDWFNRRNNELEREIIHLRQQIVLVTEAYEQDKAELIHTNQYYKRLLQANQNSKKHPKKSVRIEPSHTEIENQFEQQRQEYEKIITVLKEQNENTEQKYSSLHNTTLKLQNDYHQKEFNFAHQLDEIVKQRDTIHTQLTSLENHYEQIEEENKALKQELNSKNEVNRDLQLALISTNHENQPQHLSNTDLTELQKKYDHDIAEYNTQLESLRTLQKEIITNYDAEILKNHQTIIQLQHDNNQYSSELERYRLNINKLQAEINEKQNFIQQIQNDLSERSALYVSINNQLSQEVKIKMTRITELEQSLSQEQQSKTEIQQKLQDLFQSDKEPVDKNEKSEQHNINSNETIDSVKRELIILRNELRTKSDENTMFQHIIEDEKLKRHRLEMKIKRLKDEFIHVRTELYNRVEENHSLQYELIECRLKIDYFSHVHDQAIRSPDDNETSNILQLYLKEKADNLHYQLKCQTYQQQIDYLQRNYESVKVKHKQRLQEEKEIYVRAKMKYLDHIRNIQRDLQETRRLLEKDAETKLNQESIYQQVIDERKQLLTNMVDKDVKEREIRRENLLLTSKIQLLEKQMENLTDRIDRTAREQIQLRRDVSNVRFDINVSSENSTSSSPILPSRRTTITYIDSTGRAQPICYSEAFGFVNGHLQEVSATS